MLELDEIENIRKEAGKGTGTKENYTPWLEKDCFDSWGETKELPGRKIERKHFKRRETLLWVQVTS
jgi:hypothetical protein